MSGCSSRILLDLLTTVNGTLPKAVLTEGRPAEVTPVRETHRKKGR